MESVTSSSSPKSSHQADPKGSSGISGWWGPAAVLLLLVLLVLGFEAIRVHLSLERTIKYPESAAGSPASLPWPGAALLWFRPVDINSASLEELDLLPGVGEKGAAILLNFRMQRGFLLTVEELDQAAGPFGSDRYRYLENYLCAGPCYGSEK